MTFEHVLLRHAQASEMWRFGFRVCVEAALHVQWIQVQRMIELSHKFVPTTRQENGLLKGRGRGRVGSVSYRAMFFFWKNKNKREKRAAPGAFSDPVMFFGDTAPPDPGKPSDPHHGHPHEGGAHSSHSQSSADISSSSHSGGSHHACSSHSCGGHSCGGGH
jgi:hypothetical protein